MKSLFLLATGISILLQTLAGVTGATHAVPPLKEAHAVGNTSVLVLSRVDKVVYTREGCREVLTCTVTGEKPTWTRGDHLVPRRLRRLSSVTVDGDTEWKSSVILDPVSSSDQSMYSCQYGHFSQPIILVVNEGLAGITVNDTDISDMEHGAEFSVNCTVQSCVSDIVIQLFTGDQLVESTTVQERTRLVASARLKAVEGVVGTYVCQVMSEYENYVIRKSFGIKGVPQRRN